MVALRRGQKFGPYRIGAPIAAGGFSNVYRAHDEKADRAVALKVPAGKRMDPEAPADYRREVAENLALRHPNILRIIDHGEIDGVPFIVTPLGRKSLADLLVRGKGLSVIRALTYTRQLLLALAHAHTHRVIHCDVKPENLILLSDDRVALTDFGLARHGKRVLGDGSGTVGYMAPEQAEGRLTPRADVFAAGVVLATLLFGPLRKPRLPKDHPRLERLPPGLLPLLERALDPLPKRRFADAGEMLVELRKIERRITRKLG